MTDSTKRKNSYKYKNKSLMKTKRNSKFKTNSKTRKQFKSIRKNRIMTRQIAGFKFRFTKPPPPKPTSTLTKQTNPKNLTQYNAQTRQNLSRLFGPGIVYIKSEGTTPVDLHLAKSQVLKNIYNGNKEENLSKHRDAINNTAYTKKKLMRELRGKMNNILSQTYPKNFKGTNTKSERLIKVQEILNKSTKGVFLPTLLKAK